jgi:hypothetical protein
MLIKAIQINKKIHRFFRHIRPSPMPLPVPSSSNNDELMIEWGLFALVYCAPVGLILQLHLVMVARGSAVVTWDRMGV